MISLYQFIRDEEGIRSKWLTEEQIIGILKKSQAGMKIVDLCRMHGISDATFYIRRTKYGGMEVLMSNKCAESTMNEMTHLKMVQL